MEQSEIMKTLPHRAPMLLVDDILEVQYEKYVKGVHTVQKEEPWFQGHYPDNPVLPGAILIEIMAQVACFLYYEKESESRATPYLVKVEEMKFLKRVYPEDKILVEVILLEKFRDYFKAKCVAAVADKVVAKGSLVGWREKI